MLTGHFCLLPCMLIYYLASLHSMCPFRNNGEGALFLPILTTLNKYLDVPIKMMFIGAGLFTLTDKHFIWGNLLEEPSSYKSEEIRVKIGLPSQ